MSGVQAQCCHANEVIPTSSSTSGLYLPQAESQWSTEHSTLAFPTPGRHNTQGRRTGSSWLLQRGTRVDFSQGMLSWRAMVNLLSCLHVSLGKMGEQVLPGLLPGMALQPCTCVLFFFSGCKLGDINTLQELWPMIIIFPQ